MSSATLRLFRKTHLYFGLFISPALLFFAFTGAVQTLSLHESSANYRPPAFLAKLGQLHKKQTTVVPVRKPQESSANHDAGTAGGRTHGGHMNPPAAAPQPAVTLAEKQKQHLPLKIFFLVVALGLFSSTLTGIYMSYKYDRNKALVTAVLIAGVVTPFVLLKL
ncbi:MAG TPA: hypothetical protein VMD97_00485 [Candidatus Aquilonibacter sp.]|nr:hypothetical protein [Candidatus Aquilonibacter sp.]